jgi:HD-GYP domain-containing protein (c-di-GMP phosphodiesterase class II)
MNSLIEVRRRCFVAGPDGVGEAVSVEPRLEGGTIVNLSKDQKQPQEHPYLESDFFLKALEASPLLEEAVNPVWAKDLLQPIAENSPWRFAHSLRVALVAEELARYSGIKEEKLLKISRAGALHDNGFVNNAMIPEGLVNNEQGKWIPTSEDWEKVETHPVVSAYRISQHDSSAAQIAIGHHGFQGDRSYPVGIKDDGSELYIARRTLAMADIADAMQDPDRPHVNNETPKATRERMKINFGEEHIDLINFAIWEARKQLRDLGGLKGSRNKIS